jgi:DNA damage-binding protein 2
MYIKNYSTLITNGIIFRSLFIWKPKEKCEPVEEKDETKIVVCGKAEKKRGKKKVYNSDESDDDGFISKLKKPKSKQTEWKLSRCSTKDNR